MANNISVERYHDISCGHRVSGHESKCSHLHGHNYRIHFKVEAPQLDNIGRVLDFSVIKEKLCMWLEDNWDHKFLLWEHDELHSVLKRLVPYDIVTVDFNPTAENIAVVIYELLRAKINSTLDLKIRLYETERNFVEYPS